jgi:hypothetical protein
MVSQLCPGQSSKSKNKQRAITPKLGNAELWDFALHIYLPPKFLVDSLVVLVMSRTRKWDGGTSGQSGDYMSSILRSKKRTGLLNFLKQCYSN